MATHEERLAESIRALAKFSSLETTMTDTLRRVAELAQDAIEPAAMVGLTMEVRGGAATPVFTDELVPEIDSVQYAAGTGPCLDTFRAGRTNTIRSTRRDDRWPAFSAACVRHDVGSTLSVPVVAGEHTLGALNFYARVDDAYAPEDVDLATAFAAQAAIVISNAQAASGAQRLADQLSLALESRIIIEQAKGLLMAGGRPAADAFEILKRASQPENRKVRDVAANVVAEAERRARVHGEGPKP